MKPDIHEIGEALYGAQWQSELARATGFGSRHIRKVAAGEAVLSEAMLDAVAQVAAIRLKEVERIVKQLERRKS